MCRIREKRTGGRRTVRRGVTAVLLALAVFVGSAGNSMRAQATTIGEIQQQINEDQQNLNQINNQISNLTEEQDLVEEMISDLNAEIINMITSIGLKQDEIAAKENDIVNKQNEIDQTQLEYEEAKRREEEQYEAMKVRIRFMYENSSVSVLARVLGSSGLNDLINTAEYIEKIYEADSALLEEYVAAKNHVHELWDQLVLDKQELENEKTQLKNDEAVLQGLKSELDASLEKKKAESANYEAEIRKYRQEAENAKKKIQKEQQDLKKLQEELKKKNQPASNAANGTYSDTGYTGVVDNASGSELGKKVAKYALQFIGNPYVMGGTSLTKGADCSGFVYRVYADFGYSLPRTSYEQRSAGRGVSYSEAQPGDLICYSGHVAMYIGDGKIVHASNERTGIKVSNATYRSILAVRRIV